MTFVAMFVAVTIAVQLCNAASSAAGIGFEILESLVPGERDRHAMLFATGLVKGVAAIVAAACIAAVAVATGVVEIAW